jgi:Fe2+-dicitrate sensor, membrane component
MGHKPKDKLTGQDLEQAAQWFARSRAEDFSEEERDQFESWLRADASHRVAFKEMKEVWQEVDLLLSPSTLPDRRVAPARYCFFPWPRLRVVSPALYP